MSLYELAMNEKKEYYRAIPPVDFSLASATSSDIQYRLFDSPEENTGKLLTVDTVVEEDFNRNLPTILLFHGWTTNETSPWYKPLRDAYLRLGPHNVIYVDWSAAGAKTYQVSSANIKPVGEYIAEFLLTADIPVENIHLVGHSLGSHLTGFIGKEVFKQTGKKISRITALDPAGPAFENSAMPPHFRLCESDATFVDVIHTDIQLYGFTEPLGHVDYYPNEGKHQIGCPERETATEDEANYSHARSTLYFIESVKHLAIAKEAVFEMKNYEVSIKVKENPNEIIFGQHVDQSTRGVYYLETNDTPTFLKTTKTVFKEHHQ